MKSINKNIPNILSASRIILTPIVVLFFLLPFNNGVGYIVSFALYVLASSTDFIDGYIARKYNLISDIGKLLDAAADKCLQTSAIVLVLFNPFVQCANWIKITIILVVLLRDAWISTVRQLCASKGTIIPADIWGKIKSILMDISVGILFFFVALLHILPNGVLTTVFGISITYLCVLGLTLLAVSCVFSIVSGVNYTVKAWGTITNKKPEEDVVLSPATEQDDNNSTSEEA